MFVGWWPSAGEGSGEIPFQSS